MAKLTINDITSGYVSTTAINTAFTAIETALENTLSRDGTSPNQMSANLDMNGYAVLNARATTGNENFLWLGTWATGSSYSVNNLVYAPEGTNEGATLICVTAHIAGATLDGDAAKWAVFAQRGASGVGTGDVVGPASSTPDSLARFNGTTGKLLKDGAVIGTHVQAYDDQLTTLSGITAQQATDLASVSTFIGTLLNDADAATARATLGVVDKILQVVHFDTAAVATGTATIPLDDTIPQQTEGDQYMSLAITPVSASSTLRIDVTFISAVNAAVWRTVALFRDAGANSIGAAAVQHPTANGGSCTTFSVIAASGSTSATTFKVRAGADAAATMTFNGAGGGRLFGGVMASSIRITEIAA